MVSNPEKVAFILLINSIQQSNKCNSDNTYNSSNKKTPEGAYAGCVGLRKNYGYVGWKWKLSSVCNKCVQETQRYSVKD